MYEWTFGENITIIQDAANCKTASILEGDQGNEKYACDANNVKIMIISKP